MATQCNKDVLPSYTFTEKLDLYPEQKIYQLGDTIWIQHLNPANTVYDNHTNQNFSVDTLEINFGPIFSATYNLPFDNSGTFCNFIFQGVNVGSHFNHAFGCNNGGSFNFKVGMVLNKIGIFSIDLNGSRPVTSCNHIGPYVNGEGFPYSFIYYKFNIADGNKDIYLSISPALRGVPKDYVYPAIDNKQIFFLKVE